MLFAATIFLGAFLLFAVEFILAKRILPWFGGAPAVWTTCMLFFQLALLCGYVYAHLLSRRLAPRRQALWHGAFAFAVVAVLAAQALGWGAPLLPGGGLKPAGSEYPVLRILALLTVTVGLPFLLLSTTSSLLQSWTRSVAPARTPYPLYAVSNAGSIAALVAYPLLFEPLLSVRGQAWAWAAGFLVFAGGLLACGRRFALGGESAAARDPGSAGDPAPTARKQAAWVALSACGSVLLLATTNLISEEICVIPLLWVFPLALYLLSFILCFREASAYSRGRYAIAWLAIMGAILLIMRRSISQVGLVQQCLVYGFALFVCCMICHGELARAKPGPRHLTTFYLMLAIGGALGGVVAGVVAPALFPGLWELYIGYHLVGVILLVGAVRAWPDGLPRALRWGVIVLVLGLTSAIYVQSFFTAAVWTRRNFYGVLRVVEQDRGGGSGRGRVLVHAATVHGFQFGDPERRHLPTSYFTEQSGVGIAIRSHPRRQPEGAGGGAFRIGCVGLGVGTLAAYGRAGDTVRFYEINPAVLELSQGERPLFRFLADCPARVETVLGDARLALEREAPQNFDVLVIDAFSGDSVPVHLLTREAFRVYLRHLGPGGILAVHLSNRYIDLNPVVLDLAADLGLGSARIVSKGDEEREASAAIWMLLSADPGALALEAIRAAADEPAASPRRAARVWSDDHSDVVRVLNRPWRKRPGKAAAGGDRT